ncbi:MAG TPA: sigma-54 dependent transcriptional regulator [Candidatus Dormibacteraeota bacterium]|nr:sigma-54 dependent transcriptional regulator [Candidatus Dormibacteraeota bacterium]
MTVAKPSILVVEDEPKLRRLLELQLADEGFRARSVDNAEAGFKLANQEPFDLVLTDFKLPGMTGVEFLHALKSVDANLPVVIMTAYGTVEAAVEAMKAGASDYVLKPFALAELILIIRKELAAHEMRIENRALREALGKRYEYKNVIAQSGNMQAVLAMVERVAATNATVLLGGESGVGKDMIARAIHEHSQRAAGPFVKINSTAIPENLLESELFGYEKGAFSGATTSKPGKFELADKGTLFLDEIGDVPPVTQVKLLRVLQDREFERLGGTKTLKVDVRLIAATNRDLRAAIEEGAFREDLYYRLNVVAIDIPPLREHKEDIPALANFFLEKFAHDSNQPVRKLKPDALRKLIDYHWPGNVRELENIIARGATLALGDALGEEDIHVDSEAPSRRAAAQAPPVLPPGTTLEKWEDEIIREALRQASGNKSQAARALGLSRNALRYRLSKLGVADPDDASEGASATAPEAPRGG